jgi:hypothetical protein
MIGADPERGGAEDLVREATLLSPLLRFIRLLEAFAAGAHFKLCVLPSVLCGLYSYKLRIAGICQGDKCMIYYKL